MGNLPYFTQKRWRVLTRLLAIIFLSSFCGVNFTKAVTDIAGPGLCVTHVAAQKILHLGNVPNWQGHTYEVGLLESLHFDCRLLEMD